MKDEDNFMVSLSARHRPRKQLYIVHAVLILKRRGRFDEHSLGKGVRGREAVKQADAFSRDKQTASGRSVFLCMASFESFQAMFASLL